VNCKQGDVARLIKAAFPENVGLIVEVLCAVPPIYWGEHGPEWVCKPAWPCAGEQVLCGLALSKDFNADEIDIPDAWLRPIRPEADPVTTDCDVGVEA